VEIAFDPAKDILNRQKHGISLADAELMTFDTAYVVRDERRAYGEICYQAYGLIADRLHVLAFTMRGSVLRAISLRKANRREVQRHGR
jgi:uncharacterized DUF497 family protein